VRQLAQHAGDDQLVDLVVLHDENAQRRRRVSRWHRHSGCCRIAGSGEIDGGRAAAVDYGGGKPPQRRKSRPKRPRTVLPVWHEDLCADPDARSSPLPTGTAIAVAEDRPQS
jgi:hypothetical protein